MNELPELELRMLAIEERLGSIARRPVEIANPNWVAILESRQHPFDEAGVRAEAEGLLEALIFEYQRGDDALRDSIRDWFARCSAFSWAAMLRVAPDTADGFRRHLLLFSMKNLGTDTRDAILELQDLCARARTAGVGVNLVLREVAELSSDRDRFGMGSARSLLSKAAD